MTILRILYSIEYKISSQLKNILISAISCSLKYIYYEILFVYIFLDFYKILSISINKFLVFLFFKYMRDLVYNVYNKINQIVTNINNHIF